MQRQAVACGGHVAAECCRTNIDAIFRDIWNICGVSDFLFVFPRFLAEAIGSTASGACAAASDMLTIRAVLIRLIIKKVFLLLIERQVNVTICENNCCFSVRVECQVTASFAVQTQKL
jgi:hypothetical protein